MGGLTIAALSLWLFFNIEPPISIGAHNEAALVDVGGVWRIFKHETSAPHHTEYIQVPDISIEEYRRSSLYNAGDFVLPWRTDQLKRCVIPEFRVATYYQLTDIRSYGGPSCPLFSPSADFVCNAVAANEAHALSYILYVATCTSTQTRWLGVKIAAASPTGCTGGG